MSKALAGTALGLAIAAFILGWIPFIGWLLWLAALVVAIVAVIRCRKEGKGMAIAAIVIMAVSLLLAILLVGVGAIAYFGIFSAERTQHGPAIQVEELIAPARFAPDSLSMGDGFAGGMFEVRPDRVRLSLRNLQGAEVIVERIALESSPESQVACEAVQEPGVALAEGRSILFETEECPAAPGERLVAEVRIAYRGPGDVESRTATGRLDAVAG